MANLTQEQYIELSRRLPESLRYAIFSEQNANINLQIFEENNLPLEKYREVAKVIGDVLFGLILPEELGKNLEALGFEKETAENISQMANKMVITPVKDDIEAFRNSGALNEVLTGAKPKQEPKTPTKKPTPKAPKTTSKIPDAPITKQKPKTEKNDKYLEPIE